LVVNGAFLGINQRVIGERKQGKLSGRLFRTSIDVRMPLAGKFAISRFDLSRSSGSLNAEYFVLVNH
jgi:hypothetical protein